MPSYFIKKLSSRQIVEHIAKTEIGSNELSNNVQVIQKIRRNYLIDFPQLNKVK